MGIPVNTPVIGEAEKRYVNECLNSGWVSSEGPWVERFETAFAKTVGKRHGVAVSSGTAALDIAVKALGIGPGDEVIMPTFTIISCAAAVVKAGATPVLVDSDPTTWNMRVDDIEQRLTHRTKAVMAVHIYGLPVDMDPILELTRAARVAVIEDAAQAIGQSYKGRPCGAMGDVSVFSFYPNKHITTGEGGMVLTEDPAIAGRCRELRNLCFQPQRRFVHEDLGWNYRFGSLQAALGLGQLESLSLHLEKKRKIGRWYNELLAGMDGIQLPLSATDYAENIYWVYGIVLDRQLSLNAEELADVLARAGIGTRPFFWPMHEQPVFRRMGLFQAERHPVAERLARQGLYLPSGLALTETQAQEVADKLISNLQ